MSETYHSWHREKRKVRVTVTAQMIKASRPGDGAQSAEATSNQDYIAGEWAVTLIEPCLDCPGGPPASSEMSAEEAKRYQQELDSYLTSQKETLKKLVDRVSNAVKNSAESSLM